MTKKSDTKPTHLDRALEIVSNRDENGRFVKGNVANRYGRYHGQTLAPIKAWCRLNQDLVIEKIYDILTNPETPITIRWDCIKTIWFMLEGKPKESFEMEDKTFTSEVKRLTEKELEREKQMIDVRFEELMEAKRVETASDRTD